eukprot:7381700-Pyramimonas_sp.AAC.1
MRNDADLGCEGLHGEPLGLLRRGERDSQLCLLGLRAHQVLPGAHQGVEGLVVLGGRISDGTICFRSSFLR